MPKSKLANDNGHKYTLARFKSFIGWVLTIASWAAILFLGYVAFSIKNGFGI